MNYRIFFAIILIGSILTGCSLFERKTGTDNAIQVRDVPYQSRDQDQSAPRKRILVLPFIDADLNRSKELAEVARRMMVMGIRRSGGYTVLAVEEFPQDLAKFYGNNAYDLKSIARVAESMGVVAVVEGTLLDLKAQRMGDEVGVLRQVKYKTEATIRIRAVATRSGREIYNEARTVQHESSLTKVGQYSAADQPYLESAKVFRETVERALMYITPNTVKALDKLSWEGRVALVQADKVYINAGQISGVQIGDIMKVVEDGEEVYDPETGLLIGKAPGRMKGTVEVISYFGRDGAVGVVHSGSGFRENDHVEMY